MSSYSFPRFLFAGVAGLVVAAFAHGQSGIVLPEVSQHAVSKQRVGLTDITIDYHRPLVGGRKIWGGLVPYGDVWRAGADVNTTIEFSSPVNIEGQPLAKGIYGLHLIPTADSWTVIFSKAATSWGSYSYDKAEDALRVTVKPLPAEMREALAYEFDDPKASSVVAVMKWEKLAVPFRVSVSDEDATIPNIRAQLRGGMQYSWDSWNAAATFCVERKINLEEALKWADKSIGVEERFENLQTRANILKALNRAPEVATVQAKALEVASAQQIYSYGRQLQAQKQADEAMNVFKVVVKRFPQTIYGHLAQARLASASGDFATAAKEMKLAQDASTNDQQKQALGALVERLKKSEDINK